MLVDVTVVPKSGGFRVERRQGGQIRIHLRSPPEDNKANIELLKEMRKLLGCGVRLASGAKSRRKALEIAMGEAEWQKFVSGLGAGD